MPLCLEPADPSNHMAMDATPFWQKTQNTKALEYQGTCELKTHRFSLPLK